MSAPRIVSACLADEQRLARVARVMGPSSTSQQVIDELASRRATGEDVVAYELVTTAGRTIIVGPSLEDEAAAA